MKKTVTLQVTIYQEVNFNKHTYTSFDFLNVSFLVLKFSKYNLFLMLQPNKNLFIEETIPIPNHYHFYT